MQGLRWVQMTDEELNEFLEDGGTGILSFSTPAVDPPFSLPVSYGYYEETQSFYFRLAFPEGSGKESLLDDPVSFVVYDDTAEGYRSVVASGHLEAVADLPHDSAAVQRMWGVRIPVVDIFEQPLGDVPFQQFRLVTDELAGRKEVQSDE